MPNRTTIRPDTRFNNSVVSIRDQAGALRGNDVVLLVDTGAVQTMVSYENILRGGTWALGSFTQTAILGRQRATIEARGGALAIETEQAGGGMIQNLNAAVRIFGISDGLADVGGGAVGLLGMEAMDNINVDVQKNAAQNAARLARRV